MTWWSWDNRRFPPAQETQETVDRERRSEDAPNNRNNNNNNSVTLII